MSSDDSNDGAHSFERWSDLLGGLYIAWKATNVHFAELPPEGSPACRDDVQLTNARPEWSHHEGTGAGTDAVQMIDAAAQYLLGLKALADSRTLVLAPWPVVRAVAEHVAHAAWLLEPGIRPESRMARRWMARLAGAHRYRWMAAARNASKAQKREAKQCRERIRGELLQRFPNADTRWTVPGQDPLPPWSIAGETYPSIGAQCRLIEKLGVTTTAGVYDTLSLNSHPNPVVLTMLCDRVETNDGVTATYRVDPQQWNSAVWGASSLLYASAHAACGYFAIDPHHLDAWYDTFFAP